MDLSSPPVHDHELNRQSWNEATKQHRTHQPELISDYVDKGRNKLFAEDLELLGELQGKQVLHLQCNDGQDTVSMARWLRPRQVHGVDISDSAIDFAEELRDKMLAKACFDPGTDVCFTRCDVLEYLNDPANRSSVDVVYSSYGTVNWLCDLTAWAEGIASVLRPGGRFVIIDFHAVAMALDLKTMTLKDNCLGGARYPSTDGVSDYVGQDPAFQNSSPAVEYAWGVGDIVSSLLATKKLQVQSLTEYPYVNGWAMYADMRPYPDPSVPQVERRDTGTPGLDGLPQDSRWGVVSTSGLF